jgi:DNA (cytosine-5)-methyltransferase 1
MNNIYRHSFNHIARNASGIVQQRIDALGIGQKMQDLPEELWHPSFKFYVKEDPNRKGGPNMRMIRLDPDKPSLTVTGYIFNKFVHPYFNRFITVREAARLQGFPDDIIFTGSLGSTQLQVGNAVPIDLARAVLRSVANHASRIGFHTLQALSLFSGAGGFDIGAHTLHHNYINILPLVAVDTWKDACQTLHSYLGHQTHVVQSDITSIKNPKEFWYQHSQTKNSPHLIYGGPPCQAFSQAGKQLATEDDRGKLVFEFIRFVQELEPLYFVMENVSNLKGVQGGKLFQEIIHSFTDLGYNVESKVLDATHYGAAQRRNRIFIIGCQKHLGTLSFPEPTHGCSEDQLFPLLPFNTVGKVFSNLPPAIFTNSDAIATSSLFA